MTIMRLLCFVQVLLLLPLCSPIVPAQPFLFEISSVNKVKYANTKKLVISSKQNGV
jgi:hypothetical protein